MNPTSHPGQGTSGQQAGQHGAGTSAQAGAGQGSYPGGVGARGHAGSGHGQGHEQGQGLASAVAGQAGEAWDTAKRGAQQAASVVADTAEGAWDQLSGFVSRYPLVSMAVGGGVVFLLYEALSSGSRASYPRRGWGDDAWWGATGQRRGYEAARASHGRGEEGGFADRARDLASSAAERVGEAWESTGQMASSMANRAGQAWDSMGDWGRSYPLGTLAVGAALGFGLAQLIRGMESSGTRGGSSVRPASDSGSTPWSGGGRF